MCILFQRGKCCWKKHNELCLKNGEGYSLDNRAMKYLDTAGLGTIPRKTCLGMLVYQMLFDFLPIDNKEGCFPTSIQIVLKEQFVLNMLHLEKLVSSVISTVISMVTRGARNISHMEFNLLLNRHT